MLNGQELRSEITRLLTKVREENAALQQNCAGLATDPSKANLITLYLENMYEIRRQLQELVGETAATAMIADELGRDSVLSEALQTDLSRYESQQLESLKVTLAPPKLPTGYVTLSEPRPLIGENDDLWVVLADHGDLGLLIYEERFCRAFLVAEECITLLYTLMENAQKFFDLCTVEYLNNPVHQSGLAMIRNWLNHQKTEP